MSRVWMLFESGQAATVRLNLHEAHPETRRPIDAYLITEERGDVTTAARRGAEAAYAWCHQRNPQLPAAVVSYDLAGLGPNDSLTGGSGGLAFALALALQLRPVDLPGDIAATGEILSGHDGGPIGPVAGITTKLGTVAAKLPPNSLLFYPGDNQDELPPSLLDELHTRGHKAFPVTSVDQALEKLYAGTARRPPVPSRLRYAALVVALGLPLALAAAWIAQQHPWPFLGDAAPRTVTVTAPRPETATAGPAPPEPATPRTEREQSSPTIDWASLIQADQATADGGAVNSTQPATTSEPEPLTEPAQTDRPAQKASATSPPQGTAPVQPVANSYPQSGGGFD